MFQPSAFLAPPPHIASGVLPPLPTWGTMDGHVCIHMHTYAYVCISMRMYAHVYTSIHLYVSVLLMHACMHACMHIC